MTSKSRVTANQSRHLFIPGQEQLPVVTTHDYKFSLGVIKIQYNGFEFEFLNETATDVKIKNILKEFKKTNSTQTVFKKVVRREISLVLETYYSKTIKDTFVGGLRGKSLIITGVAGGVINLTNVDANIEEIKMQGNLDGKNLIKIIFETRDKFPEFDIL